MNGVSVSIGGSSVVIDGQTITSIPSVPTTVVANGGQTLILSSGYIISGSTTVPLFAPGGNNGPAPTVVGGIPAKPTSFVVNGVSVSIGGSSIVIGGQTITSIPSVPTTVVANGQTFILSSGSIITPSTTIAIFGAGSPGGSLTVTTIGDITISLGPSIAVISGKTYTFGPTVVPTTTVVNGQTISIGPGGVGFPTKTIAPSLFTGGAAASRGLAKFSGRFSALFLVLAGLL